MPQTIYNFSFFKLLLEGGKHVLCEKPFTMNEKQTRKLISLSKEKKLFLMEAVWSRFFPVYKELKKVIDAGEIGEVGEKILCQSNVCLIVNYFMFAPFTLSLISLIFNFDNNLFNPIKFINIFRLKKYQ